MSPAHSGAPFRLGLTGGVGSGKSTVAQMLLELDGCTLLDADQMARAVTGPGGAAIDAIAHTFGSEFVDSSGAMDRTRMRTLAFSRPASRKQLDSIVHPLILQRTEEQAMAATAAGKRLLVFDIPLLVESGHWLRKLDAVAVVDCQEQTQIARVMARSGLSAEAVQSIMDSQAPRVTRRAAADAVIYNDGLSLQGLHAQVRLLACQFGL